MPRAPDELRDKIFWRQLHTFQLCNFLFCFVPCVYLAMRFYPRARVFIEHRYRGAESIAGEILLAVGLLFAFVLLAWGAGLVGAMVNVLVVRWSCPALRGPTARAVLLQLYSDPRWLYQGRGFKTLSPWIFLWPGAGKKGKYPDACQRLTSWTIRRVYGDLQP